MDKHIAYWIIMFFLGVFVAGISKRFRISLWILAFGEASIFIYLIVVWKLFQ